MISSRLSLLAEPGLCKHAPKSSLFPLRIYNNVLLSFFCEYIRTLKVLETDMKASRSNVNMKMETANLHSQ